MKDKILEIIKSEQKRQESTIQMIPSENWVSKQVREAVGSVLLNKYSEGYSQKRYYQGNKYIDEIEEICIEEAKKVFKVEHVNIQPYSGSPANTAVLFGLLEKGDTIMGLSLSSGGHLTHGHPNITFSGKYFNSIQYTVNEKGYLDYQEIEKLAKKYKPKLIISGSTAYTRKIDFKKFGEISKKVGAYHMADISHISGLVAGGVHQSPVRYADIVTTTTHKTLRGPRGAMIMITKRGLEKDFDLPQKIDKAVFPGLQGGPHNNTTAGIAICLKEAQTNEFKQYANQIINNSRSLSNYLKKHKFNLITNGTDNHLILIDTRNKEIDGWCAAWALEYAGIIVNRNSIPNDNSSPFYPSGIRLGTPFITTIGMKENDMKFISECINEVFEISRDHLFNVELNKETRKSFKQDISKDKRIIQIKKNVENYMKRFRKYYKS